MVIRLSPGWCNCCGCFSEILRSTDTSLSEFTVIDGTLSKATGAAANWDQTDANGLAIAATHMPTLSEWTARVALTFDSSGRSHYLVFGADDSGNGGYRLEVLSETDGVTLTLRDRSTTLVEDSVTFKDAYYQDAFTISAVALHKSDCGAYGSPIQVLVQLAAGTGARTEFVKCFDAPTLTDDRWGFEQNNNITTGIGYADFGYGYIDPSLRDMTTTLVPYCHVCGSYPFEFGGAAVDCLRQNVKVTISGLLSYYEGLEPVGSGTVTFSNADQNNGTYILSSGCPGCFTDNHILTFEYDYTGFGTGTNYFSFDMARELIAYGETATYPGGDSTAQDLQVTTSHPIPYFVNRHYEYTTGTATSRKFVSDGNCKLTKPAEPYTIGDRMDSAWPLALAKIDIEWYT